MKKSAKSESTRRNFIKGASLSASGIMIVPRHVLGGKGFVAPSDKVTLGIVGASAPFFALNRILYLLRMYHFLKRHPIDFFNVNFKINKCNLEKYTYLKKKNEVFRKVLSRYSSIFKLFVLCIFMVFRK